MSKSSAGQRDSAAQPTTFRNAGGGGRSVHPPVAPQDRRRTGLPDAAHFFVLPAVLAVAVADQFGYDRLDWHVFAAASCFGTIVFAIFKGLIMPAAFQQAVQRHQRRGGRNRSGWQ